MNGLLFELAVFRTRTAFPVGDVVVDDVVVGNIEVGDVVVGDVVVGDVVVGDVVVGDVVVRDVLVGDVGTWQSKPLQGHPVEQFSWIFQLGILSENAYKRVWKPHELSAMIAKKRHEWFMFSIF